MEVSAPRRASGRSGRREARGEGGIGTASNATDGNGERSAWAEGHGRARQAGAEKAKGVMF